MHRIALAALAVTLAAAPVAADDAAEAEFSSYHRAIAAADRCADMDFSQADHNAMSTYIDAQLGRKLGAGRMLTLIDAAKDDVRDAGCDDPMVQEALVLFEMELKPELP